MPPGGTEPPVPLRCANYRPQEYLQLVQYFITNNKINFDQVGIEPPVPSDKESRESNKNPIFLCQLLSLKNCPLKISNTIFPFLGL